MNSPKIQRLILFHGLVCNFASNKFIGFTNADDTSMMKFSIGLLRGMMKLFVPCTKECTGRCPLFCSICKVTYFLILIESSFAFPFCCPPDIFVRFVTLVLLWIQKFLVILVEPFFCPCAAVLFYLLTIVSFEILVWVTIVV